MSFAVNSPSRNSTNPVITGLGRLRLMNSLPEGQVSFGGVSLTMPYDDLYILPISISDCGGFGGVSSKPVSMGFFPVSFPFSSRGWPGDRPGDNLLCFHDMKIPIAH